MFVVCIPSQSNIQRGRRQRRRKENNRSVFMARQMKPAMSAAKIPASIGVKLVRFRLLPVAVRLTRSIHLFRRSVI